MRELFAHFHTFMSVFFLISHFYERTFHTHLHFYEPITENFYIFPKVAILKGRIIERTDNTYEAD